MKIKEIYKFLQYFELEADEYKRIPAVSRYATSNNWLCFILFAQKWIGKMARCSQVVFRIRLQFR